MSVVAVIDTSVDVLEILQEILEDEGHTVATAQIAELMDNAHDLSAFFQSHRPHAVVYHLTLPYMQNWVFFCEYVLAPGYVPEACFVLTTTNQVILETFMTATPYTIDLVGRPFDLDVIVEHVDRAVRAYHTTGAMVTQQASAQSS